MQQLSKFCALLFAMMLVLGLLGCPQTTTEQVDPQNPTYSVSYADGVDGAEIAVPSDTTAYHAGDTVTVKFEGIGTRDGYTFAGWSDGTTTYAPGGTTTFTIGSANVTLTAQWLACIGTKAPNEAKSVGDIVFKDGTATSYSANLTLTDEQKAAAVAVIFYVGTGDATIGSNENILGRKTLGVALKNSSTEQPPTKYQWAKRKNESGGNVYGFYVDYTPLHAYRKYQYFNREGNIASSDVNMADLNRPYYTSDGGPQMDGYFHNFYYGDMDGSDNWEKIWEYGSYYGDRIEDYPAFKWVLNYGENHGITGTYATGWYMPTLTELCILHDNRADVKNAFAKLGEADPFGDTNECGRDYWSSNQYPSELNSGEEGMEGTMAYALNIGYDYNTGCPIGQYKGNPGQLFNLYGTTQDDWYSYYVLCIRQF